MSDATSPRRPGHPEFYELLNRMADLHSRKNHDYAGLNDPFSNFRQCEAFGIPAWKGAVVRLGDKYSRLVNFARVAALEVADEKIEDTLLDLAVYALITRILYIEATVPQPKPKTHDELVRERLANRPQKGPPITTPDREA